MSWFKKKDSIGGLFHKAFGVDENTPQRTQVWGTCYGCNQEGWADKTFYNDQQGTTYYTCLNHGCKDNFSEHAPTYSSGLRRKWSDKPLRGDDAYE